MARSFLVEDKKKKTRTKHEKILRKSEKIKKNFTGGEKNSFELELFGTPYLPYFSASVTELKSTAKYGAKFSNSVCHKKLQNTGIGNSVKNFASFFFLPRAAMQLPIIFINPLIEN